MIDPFEFEGSGGKNHGVGRSAYRAPSLTCYGSVAALTAGNPGTRIDGDCEQGNRGGGEGPPRC